MKNSFLCVLAIIFLLVGCFDSNKEVLREPSKMASIVMDDLDKNVTKEQANYNSMLDFTLKESTKTEAEKAEIIKQKNEFQDSIKREIQALKKYINFVIIYAGEGE